MLASLLTALLLCVSPDEAEDNVQRALLRQTLPLLAEQPMSEEMVGAYRELYARAWRLGDEQTAHAALERIVPWWEDQFGAESLVLASRLNDVGILLFDLRDFAMARPLFERALAIREASLGPEHRLVASTLNRLSLLHSDLGDYAAARPVAERVLAISETLYGPTHQTVGTSLTNLAALYSNLGEDAAARPLAERALAIREAGLAPGHPAIGGSLTILSNLLLNLGDHAAALPHSQRALAICEAANGPVHPDVASVLTNLSNLNSRLGNHELARSQSERSLAICEATHGPQHPAIATSLHNLAVLLDVMQDSSAARPLYERSLAIREASLGPMHPDVASSLNNLAVLLSNQGEYGAARLMWERALAIWEQVLDSDHPVVADGLCSMIMLALDEGDPEAAFALARRITDQRARVLRTLAYLTEGESHAFLSQRDAHGFAVLAAAAAVGDDEAAYASVLQTKGKVARLTLQVRAQAQSSLDPETLALAESLREVAAQMSRLALTTDIANREAHDGLLESLRAERDALDRALHRRADLAEGRAVTPEDIVKMLPPGSAVVDLAVHRAYVPAVFRDGSFSEAGRWSERRVSAWVVRQGEASVSHIDLGPAPAIEKELAAFLEDLVAEDLAALRGRAVGRPQQPETLDGTLRSLVWDPLVAHLDGISQVFLSPDGALGTLPFETLKDDNGRYLIEDYAFVYPTSVATMVEQGGAPGGVGGPLLSVGGVDFGDQVEPASGAGSGTGSVSSAPWRGGLPSSWDRLPATLSESQQVADMHADALGDETRRLLLQGTEASEERLKEELPRHAILHLATHGFFLPEGLPSMWDRAPGGMGAERKGALRVSESSRRLTGLHPGLLSGLVFADANRPPSDEDERDDGYLTAAEVMLLDLSAVDLVVLSACETGLGRPESGEGLLGLRRAFQVAGANTVVSSLWSVQDERTGELMRSFYRKLFSGDMGRQEALREAQLEMLASNRSDHGADLPSTWGAFVLSGEWR